MLYPICPTCGTILANVQLPYTHDILELCEQHGVDHEMLSQGTLSNNKEFTDKKREIVEKYVDNICCKMRLTNFTDVVKLILDSYK